MSRFMSLTSPMHKVLGRNYLCPTHGVRMDWFGNSSLRKQGWTFWIFTFGSMGWYLSIGQRGEHREFWSMFSGLGLLRITMNTVCWLVVMCVDFLGFWCWSLEVQFQDAMNKISQMFGWTVYGSGNADSILGISSVPNFWLQRFFHLQVIKEPDVTILWKCKESQKTG
jgi:hypothetical protein